MGSIIERAGGLLSFWCGCLKISEFGKGELASSFLVVLGRRDLVQMWRAAKATLSRSSDSLADNLAAKLQTQDDFPQWDLSRSIARFKEPDDFVQSKGVKTYLNFLVEVCF